MDKITKHNKVNKSFKYVMLVDTIFYSHDVQTAQLLNKVSTMLAHHKTHVFKPSILSLDRRHFKKFIQR